MPLEVLCSEVLKVEEIANELPSTFGKHDCVRLSNTLQASRKVRRLAYDCLLLGSARANQVADGITTKSDFVFTHGVIPGVEPYPRSKNQLSRNQRAHIELTNPACAFSVCEERKGINYTP
jgi:hypothetical protein